MSSEDMPADHRHKLDKWIKELNIPASRVGQAPRFKIRHEGRAESQIDIEKVHEAWRYGVAIDHDDEISILMWLEDVNLWIRDSLKEA